MAVVPRTMKKLVNDPSTVVKESLAGLAAAHGDLLRYDAEAQFVVRADAPVPGRVALVSGGGSGHEPLHGGLSGHSSSLPPAKRGGVHGSIPQLLELVI